MVSAPTFAVGNVQIETDGATSGQVTLVLEDSKGQAVKEDEDSDRRRGIFWWRNRDSGTYTVRTLVDGKSVGSPQTIMVRDNETVRYRVNTATGVATAVTATMIGRQQQQQNMFWLGGMLGYSYTHSDNSISSPFGSASSGINGGGFTGGLELTVNPFARRLNQLANVFFFASVIGDNTDESKAYVSFHPTPGLDSGGSVDIKYSVRGGAGMRFTVAPDTALAVMAGLAYSRAKSTAFTDESGGGGVMNQFSKTQGLWGPMLGLELAYGLRMFQGVGSQVFMRAERTWMTGDTNISGTSTLGFPYSGSSDIKYTDRFMLGLRFALK
jgi:hypothetical protein